MAKLRWPIEQVTLLSKKGMRPSQEDHVLVNEERGIFAVADGFGGPGPGGSAARIACESTKAFLEKEAGDDDATLPFELRRYFSLAGNILFNAVMHANRMVNKENHQKNINEKGGASLLAGYMDGDLLALANVGACSAWLFRGGKARALVVPRSYARLEDPFRGEELRHRDAPLMAVGMGNSLEPEIVETKVHRGDWVLLHTDGLPPGAREGLMGLQEKNRGGDAHGYLGSLQYEDNISLSLVFF